ncbi:MAG TPA: hypothetical protein VFY29_20490 [Terriglobia bacterium]|nr:hypothetical protein [Terriglobia bacterium]
MSELLDRLIEAARKQGSAHTRSVAGTIDIDDRDPHLDSADDAIRELFPVLNKPTKKNDSRGSTS